MGERPPKPIRLKSDPRMTVEFTGPNQTEDAGVVLLKELMHSLQWNDLLREHVRFQRNPWGMGYSTHEMLTQVVQCIALEARRPEHFEALREDEALREILGVDCLAGPDTVLRFLREVPVEGLEQICALGAAVRRRLLRGWDGPLDLDPDGVVVTLYGKQEGAEKGYNPDHRGKKSYWPLVVTAPGPDLVMRQKLRPGNSGAATGDLELLQQIAQEMGAETMDRIRVRADVGHYSDDLMSLLEDLGWPYAIKARQTAPLMGCVAEVLWTPGRLNGRELEFGEFRYGPKQRRMVLMRRPRPVRDAQGWLLLQEAYEYQVLATSLRWKPERVFEYYNGRGTAETQHEDLLQMGYGLAVTDEFLANEVWSELVALAYNLLAVLRREGRSRRGVKPKVRTFRDRMLRVAGVLVRHARRLCLRLKEGWRRQPEFVSLLAYAARGP